MKLPLAIRFFSYLCFAITSTIAISLSKPGCQEKCGNVTIPYPFGIGSECSANSSFTVICQNSTNPHKPFLSSLKLELVTISLHGVVIVNLPVSPMNCSDGARSESLLSLNGSPFTVSAHYNSLVVMGCKNSVWLRANETTVGGCMAICDANSTDTSCNGVNCCQATIPTRFQEIQFTYESIQARNQSSFCGYVFPANKKWLQNEVYKRYKGLLSDLSNPIDREFEFAPLVLEWEFVTEAEYSNNTICKNPDDYRPQFISHYDIGLVREKYPDNLCQSRRDDPRCLSLLHNYEHEYSFSFYYSVHEYVSSSRYCSCSTGYEGNPNILGGCSDIDECSNAELNTCGPDISCTNTIGAFSCDYGAPSPPLDPPMDENDGFRIIIKIASIVIGSVLGVLILLTPAWKFGKAITELIKAMKASRKYMFFKRNGGLLLEQQLGAIHENGLEKTRLFSSGELAKATDDYNENRIVGRGGEGIVYKGMLEDGRIVAVKKSERVHQGDVEAFINEIVIVSQINHRNVVKLIGCCLESEVPRLVYEFIPNGTLFHHIHDPHEDFPLFWEMRVRIAKEVAGALAYLHSARKCLHLNGKSRPTMKEVARDLDAIQVAKEESDIPENQIESSSYSSSEDGESEDISISEIMQLHTIDSHSPDTTQYRFLDEP